MAKATMKLPDDFLQKVSRLGDKTDEIVPRVLKAGAEVVEDKIRDNLKNVISGTGTGQLVAALGTSGARQDKDGNFNVKIGFDEPRRDGDSNAKIANILEYGRSGQPARPFLKPAKTATHKACIEIMTEQLEKEIEGI